MSDASSKRDMATNRLLDILRSQDSDDDSKNTDNKAVEEAANKSETVVSSIDSSPISQPISFGKKKKKIPFTGSNKGTSAENPETPESEVKIAKSGIGPVNTETKPTAETLQSDNSDLESPGVLALRKKLDKIRKGKKKDQPARSKNSTTGTLFKDKTPQSTRDVMPRKSISLDDERTPGSKLESKRIKGRSDRNKPKEDDGKLLSILNKFDDKDQKGKIKPPEKEKVKSPDDLGITGKAGGILKKKFAPAESGKKSTRSLFKAPAKSSFVIRGSDEPPVKDGTGTAKPQSAKSTGSSGKGLLQSSDGISSQESPESGPVSPVIRPTIAKAVTSHGSTLLSDSQKSDIPAADSRNKEKLSPLKPIKAPDKEETPVIESDIPLRPDNVDPKQKFKEQPEKDYDRPGILAELEKITGKKSAKKTPMVKRVKNPLLSETKKDSPLPDKIFDENLEEISQGKEKDQVAEGDKPSDAADSVIGGKNLIPSVFKKSKGKKKSKEKNKKPGPFAKIGSIFSRISTKGKKKEKVRKSKKDKSPIRPSRFVSIDQIVPESFDSSLVKYLEAEEVKTSTEDYLRILIRRLDESWIKLSIVTDEKVLWLVQMSVGLNGSKIDKYKMFSLPFQSEEKTIQNMNELLNYVLAKEVSKVDKKVIFGSYFSSQLQSKTQILQTPELNKKELADLVIWNSGKNLPFPSEQAVSNWEVSKEVDKAKKKDVVIGVLDRKSLNSVERIFYKNGIRLRLVTTMPILIWKLFVSNYPDRKSKCNVLIHIGENHTILLVVNNHKLLFTREIAIGTTDFYKAVMQRVETSEGKILEIDEELARQIIHQYGFPKNNRGFTVGSNINLYKLSIFLRPIVERISGEVGRSLNYFKKQNPDLIWEELVFEGLGATLPNLAETLRDNLNIDVSLINPIRSMKLKYLDTEPIADYKLPTYALNFALMDEKIRKLNLLPEKIRSGHKNILFSKIASIVTMIIFPMVVLSSFFSSMEMKSMTDQIKLYNNLYSGSKAHAREFFELQGDIAILETYQSFIENDRTNSENIINIMKIIASKTPAEIKITDMDFIQKIGNQEGEIGVNLNFESRPKYIVEIKGLVNSDASVANIQLANFRVDLKRTRYFKDIFMTTEDISSSTGGKLLFTIQIEY